MTETNLALNEEKRTVIFEDDHVFNRIYSQLDDMDFFSTKTSALVNGGCGLGKTTALFDERMYKLYAKKLEVDEPKILVIESRALTRDQQNMINRNPNVHCLQYVGATITNLDQYHMIIIDEAHSLFTDSEFAPMTAPLCDWLKNDCHCFQIYVTASDKEFLAFAQDYFDEHEFRLTFPNLDEIHVRYVVQEMIISVNVRKTEVVIEQKEEIFFKEGNRGVFFVWSAAEASQLYLKYSRMGYRCGFYASPNSTVQVTKEMTEEVDDESETTLSYSAKVSIANMIEAIEKDRADKGLPALKHSLERGIVPDDIDFLFVTSVLQEGFALSDKNNFNFFFIEDMLPASADRKISCYHNNIPLVYLSVPRRRLEKLFIKALNKIDSMEEWTQERRRGYYEKTIETPNAYHNIIWIDRKGKYRLAQNYISYIMLTRNVLNYVESITTNAQKMISFFGTLSNKCSMENIIQEKRMRDYIESARKIVDRWDGRPL